jgi:hypothetical protein
MDPPQKAARRSLDRAPQFRSLLEHRDFKLNALARDLLIYFGIYFGRARGRRS